MDGPAISLRFPQGRFAELRARLLEDLDRESFAILFAKREEVGDATIFRVVDVRHLAEADYERRGPAHLRPKREAIHRILGEFRRRFDVDTLIDVHTHPFCQSGAAFSGLDDRDEAGFCRWLADTFEGVHYASVVLSRTDCAARLWRMAGGAAVAVPARVKTQTALEAWPDAAGPDLDCSALESAADPEQGFLARSALALGLDTLRRIVDRQRVAVVGVGGLGSAIAENLVHMGFHDLCLIDPDRVEPTNLNRIVGTYHSDAVAGRPKVEAVARHLKAINPRARIAAHAVGVEDDTLLPVLAGADWIVAATDNQLSRFKAQRIALRYFVPLISAGVSLVVESGRISDMSGEAVVVRAGDGLCLHCLGRLNPTQIAAEEQAGRGIGEALVARGYVRGQAVREPAVKTLNAIVAAMAVEALVEQYAGRQAHVPVRVYENNAGMAMYADTLSVEGRAKPCFVCGAAAGWGGIGIK